jgi:RNA polymerase sigma-70 factor (ECF subfamily)
MHRAWLGGQSENSVINQKKGNPVTTLSLLDPHTSRALTTAFERVCASTSAPSNDPDHLVSAAVNGDSAAIDGVLRWIRPYVLRYCRSRVGRREELFTSADDVAQEVCIAVLTSLPSYRDQGRSFLAFVYGIAAHKVVDARRSAARNRTEPIPVPDTTDLANGPETQVINGDLAGRMTRLLECVSEKQREILHLRVVVGLSAEETAEVVGSTPGAVRVAQHRALNRLHDLLTTNPSAHAETKVATPSSIGPDQLFTEWRIDGRPLW